jgi:hypothetical protein
MNEIVDCFEYILGFVFAWYLPAVSSSVQVYLITVMLSALGVLFIQYYIGKVLVLVTIFSTYFIGYAYTHRGTYAHRRRSISEEYEIIHKRQTWSLIDFLTRIGLSAIKRIPATYSISFEDGRLLYDGETWGHKPSFINKSARSARGEWVNRTYLKDEHNSKHYWFHYFDPKFPYKWEILIEETSHVGDGLFLVIFEGEKNAQLKRLRVWKNRVEIGEFLSDESSIELKLEQLKIVGRAISMNVKLVTGIESLTKWSCRVPDKMANGIS